MGSKDYTKMKTNYLNSYRSTSNQEKYTQESKREKNITNSCCQFLDKVIKEKDELIKVLLNDRIKLKNTVILLNQFRYINSTMT
jgi:hypothetical protein